MEIYNDYELNRIANEIRDEIEKIGQSISATMEHPTEADVDEAKRIMAKVFETPTSFANELFSRNLRKLNVIKDTVGYNDDAFKELSEGLAMVIIGIINYPIANAKMMIMASDFKSSLNDPDILKLKQKVTESAGVLNSLNNLKISPNVKYQISNLQETIQFLEKKFNPSSGCYIATYVYGKYDAPEVIKLRLFRDLYLSESWVGRQFIKFYYFLSPKIISIFSENKAFRKLNKTLLDTILKTLKL